MSKKHIERLGPNPAFVGSKEKPDLLTQLLRGIENTSDLIIVTDQNGNVSFANPSCLNALGHTEADLLGKPFASVLLAGECLLSGHDGSDKHSS